MDEFPIRPPQKDNTVENFSGTAFAVIGRFPYEDDKDRKVMNVVLTEDYAILLVQEYQNQNLFANVSYIPVTYAPTPEPSRAPTFHDPSYSDHAPLF